MSSVDTITIVRNKFRALLPVLDERMRRLWAANEAHALGWGGIATVAKATGLSRTTIRVGLKELNSPDLKSPNNHEGLRQSGAGRPGLEQVDETLGQDLQSLLLASTQDDPDTPLHWTCKSTRQLARALVRQGHQVSHTTLANLIRELGYRLQGTRRSAAEKNQRDYDTKFHLIKEQVKTFTGSGRPVIAIEMLNKIPNADRHSKSTPVISYCSEGMTTSFAESSQLTSQPLWQKNDILQDKLAFAVECLENWWSRTGNSLYPYNQEMLVITDCSNGGNTTSRLWRKAFQDRAPGTGLQIVTDSLPAGAYKWRQLTQTMYYQLIENWPNGLQCSQGVFISLIGASTGNTNSFS
jgi:transposase